MLNHSGKMWLLILFLLLMSFSPVQSEAMTIPPIPSDGEFIQDYASIITPGAKEDIKKIQQTAYEAHDTPIIVVTIESMSKYGASDVSIENFSKAWFDAWEIGKKDPSGRLINKGILLLVSTGDRKARIELGADWGKDWNRYAEEIMQKKIIPHFKQGDYSGGIAAGVAALGEMAKQGPGSAPPQKNLQEYIESAKLPITPFSGMLLVSGTVFGMVIIIIGLFTRPHLKKPVIVVGITIVSVFLITYLLVPAIIILAVFMDRRGSGNTGIYSDSSYYSYDNYSSGGSYDSGSYYGSGGYSGGGGASGSW